MIHLKDRVLLDASCTSVLLRIIGLREDHRGSFTTAVGLLQDRKFHRDINGGYLCVWGVLWLNVPEQERPVPGANTTSLA